MFNWIKKANEAVRKGNSYRLEKYGPIETISENYSRIQGARAQETLDKLNIAKENLKNSVDPMYYEYQIQYTGARFSKVRNHLFDIDPKTFFSRYGIPKIVFLKKMKMGSTCKYKPITGLWFEEINVRLAQG